MRRELTAVTKQRDKMTKYANKLAHGFPDGMLPKDFEVLREANLGLAVELTAVTKQRDELKNKLEKSKSYKNVMKRDNAELRKQRDEAVNNYETAQLLSVRVEVMKQYTRLPHIIVDGYWVDDRTEFEGYVISQTHDVEEDDNSIFFYGLSESQIAESLGKETGADFVITRYEVAN